MENFTIEELINDGVKAEVELINSLMWKFDTNDIKILAKNIINKINGECKYKVVAKDKLILSTIDSIHSLSSYNFNLLKTGVLKELAKRNVSTK